MKGLIYKDLLCLRKSAGSFAAVLVIYMALTVMGVWDFSYVAVFMAVLVSMLPYSCFSYDAMAKWDLYGLALPVSRRGIVLARYVVVLAMLALSIALVLVLGAGLTLLGGMGSMSEYVLSAAVALGMGILINAVLMPLLYRFGAERARLLFFAVFGAVVLLVLIVGVGASMNDTNFWDQLQPGTTALGVLIVGAALLAASYFLSVRIYTRREI